MVVRICTTALQGIKVVNVNVEIQLSSGLPAFIIVGLPNKTVAESRERVRAALVSIGLSLPAKRIIVNLAPADILKEGSHYDLPIALGLMAAMGVIDPLDLGSVIALGELSLDGRISAVPGVLPAALHANSMTKTLFCPAANGREAAWAGEELNIIACDSILDIMGYLKGELPLSRPAIEVVHETNGRASPQLDMRDIKGQEVAKRAMEVAAAGAHNLLMIGPPGSGKSMLAARLPSLLPVLDSAEALDVSLIKSVVGDFSDGQIAFDRPFRAPHHSCSMAALVGGGTRARPGEISLAHRGVLFLDELPEFSRQALDALRAPLETGYVVVARANHHVTYPSQIQLIAAMNPCKCGSLEDGRFGCKKPGCAKNYRARVSGPIMDRIDIHIEVPALSAADLIGSSSAETTETVAQRVLRARQFQRARYGSEGPRVNSQVDGEALTQACHLNGGAKSILSKATDKMKLSARGYHRVLRVARTIADLECSDSIHESHISEAVSYRQISSVW